MVFLDPPSPHVSADPPSNISQDRGAGDDHVCCEQVSGRLAKIVKFQKMCLLLIWSNFKAISRPPPPPYKPSYCHIWLTVPQKFVMNRLYINLYSFENQPKDKLNPNLKDFDTIGDCFERFFSSSTYLLSINTSYLSLFPNPPENCHQLSYFGKPPPPP